MIRKTPASSMQKTYDECYLICSTAIYFEGQNNEAEALRSWRNALDQIYYHNAYKMPASYSPRTETEKALQDSLRAMELQCKDRVDLLEALKKSRLEAEEGAKSGDSEGPSKSKESLAPVNKSTDRNGQRSNSWLGGDTVPPATYADLPRPPPLPERRPPNRPSRPSYRSKKSSVEKLPQSDKLQRVASPPSLAAPVAENSGTRTPSPDKKSGGMLRTLRSNPRERPSSGSSGKIASSLRSRPPAAAAKAASQVWSGPIRPSSLANGNSSSQSGTTWDPYTRSLVDRTQARDSNGPADSRRASGTGVIRPPSPSDYLRVRHSVGSVEDFGPPRNYHPPYPEHLDPFASFDYDPTDTATMNPPPPPPHRVPAVSPIPLQPSVSAPPPSPPVVPTPPPQTDDKSKQPAAGLSQMTRSSLSYMKEYPNHPPIPKITTSTPLKTPAQAAETSRSPRVTKVPPVVPRKGVGRASGVVSATAERQKLDNMQSVLQNRIRTNSQTNQSDYLSSSPDQPLPRIIRHKADEKSPNTVTPPTTDDSPDSDGNGLSTEEQQWEARVKQIMKKLPKGVDENAAKQIFNEIVIKGDEVHWDDVAGLEIAKSALKETVVYPFLRPDLFMGLREPARGMLLFGPPGTGKTMLARAVATESKSVFFAISASSLTSKFLGESEKLVRALFALAKELAPSIIFVDEIDSLLGSRGGSSEHEATRRIKTEFLIQWSDLQKAAAGRADPDSKGDATRVLVLAATNLPWAIDEAARRRFVRRQYIPLPEDWVRERQLRTLLSAQKHSLKDRHLKILVALTDGFSGSDITALAKDAAMGPLRSLGEKLLNMSPDDIRPIGMQDFEASLVNIRPSVSKQGLKEFEDWAKEFGERGG